VSRRDRSGGLDGVLVVAKPTGPTSHDVVDLVRRLSSTRRVGHGGTLDPFAAGVLPVFLGRATRLVEYHLGGTKRYRATICLGETSTTDDIDGERTPGAGPAPGREVVEAALAGFVGPLRQVPPQYSAVQVAGRRAYQLARKGEAVELAPRDVVVHEATLLEWDDADPARPVAVVEVACSAGTYIRALARDLGAGLGVGGHLTALRRTRVGPYRIDAAHTLEELQKELTVLPLADAATAAFPRWDLDERRTRLAVNGVRLEMPDAYAGAGPVAVFDPAGRFVALVEEQKGKAKSLAMFG
jgi:tRNA pseudouridine55 synthase